MLDPSVFYQAGSGAGEILIRSLFLEPFRKFEEDIEEKFRLYTDYAPIVADRFSRADLEVMDRALEKLDHSQLSLRLQGAAWFVNQHALSSRFDTPSPSKTTLSDPEERRLLSTLLFAIQGLPTESPLDWAAAQRACSRYESFCAQARMSDPRLPRLPLLESSDSLRRNSLAYLRGLRVFLRLELGKSPQIPDPFGGLMRHAPRGNHTLIWSRGEDGKDNNGDDLDDIVFRAR